MKITPRIMMIATLLLGQVPLAHADEAIPSSKAMRSLLVDVTKAGKRVVAVGERGHVIYSDDDGKTWHQARVPTSALLTAVFFIDAKLGWAVGHDTQILATEDGGETWQVQHKAEELVGAMPLLDIWFANAKLGYAVGSYGAILRTEDGGKHWQDWSENIENEDQLHYNSISGRGDGTVFIAGEQGMLFRSVNNGAEWETLESPYEGSWFGVLATKTPGEVYVCGLQGHVFHSSDNGASWNQVETGTNAGLTAINQLENGAVLVSGSGGNVLRTSTDAAEMKLLVRSDRQTLMGMVSTGSAWVVAVGEGGVKLVAPDGSSPDTH